MENAPAAGSGVLAYLETGCSVVSWCENEHYKTALLQNTVESFLDGRWIQETENDL